MRIGSFLPAQPSVCQPLEAIRARFPGHEWILDPATATGAAPTLDVILTGRLDRSVFEAAARLKAVFTPIAGLNHLPADLLLERKVEVYNVHGNAGSVAERALALTLAFYGRVVEFHNDLGRTRWHGFWVGRGAEDDWTSIHGRPAAIFGTGAIGATLARMLKAFDCPVTGYRRRPGLPLPPHFDRLETDLARAVAEAELLFIALPLTPATQGLFSRDLLLSARGKFLVNVGRGPIVDEEGLYLALKAGILKGAAIDTWYAYPQGGAATGAPSRFPIHELPNVMLSPHVAGSASDSMPRRVDEMVRNLAQWLDTGRCPAQVDLRERY